MTRMNEAIVALVRERMASDHKYACVWGCGNDVVAADMPRVTCCKPCYAKLRKENPNTVKKLETWYQFLERTQGSSKK